MTVLEREDVERLQADVCRAMNNVAGAVRLLAYAAAFAATVHVALLGLLVLGLAKAL